MANNNFYKIKSTVIAIIVFFVLNAYLVYSLTRYVIDKSVMTLFILIGNEMFLFMGVLFYLMISLKLEVKDYLEQIEYTIKKRGRK